MMESHLLQVPKGIRYVGDWPGFKLEDFPHIIDKKIPGCGFTEYCITNSENIILCSPRRILLENKTEQHRDDVFYVINDYEKVVGIDKDINKCQIKKNNKSNVPLPILFGLVIASIFFGTLYFARSEK